MDDGSVMDIYPTPGLPTTWFIDADGRIVGKQLGEMSEAELVDRIAAVLENR